MTSFNQIENHILFNSFHMKMVMQNCQDLCTMISCMIGDMEKNLPT